LERPGRRSIRWDIRTTPRLVPTERDEIARYLRQRGLLETFLRGGGGESGDESLKPVDQDGLAPSRTALAEFDSPENDGTSDEEEAEPYVPLCDRAAESLVLPSFYETQSTVILMANSLGDRSWERIHSRLRIFVWEPTVDEQIRDLEAWDPSLPGAILGVIQQCHARGEVVSLDLRAIENARELLWLGEAWEDGLRDSFFTPGNQEVLEDAEDVLDWLLEKQATPGKAFTERELYQSVATLRGHKREARRSAALDYLSGQGFIERFRPPSHLRVGAKGRRAGRSFRVLRLP
jgi:hypothetical protein